MARVEIPIVVDKLVSSNWQPASGASVQVNVRGGGAATVYTAATAGSVLPNPLTTDSEGRVTGYVDEGSYDFVVSGSGITTYTVEAELSRGDSLISIAGTRIANDAIGTLKIADNAVTTPKLASASVTQAKLGSDVALVPAGAVLPFGGDAAPTGYLLCDGASYTTASQSALFNVIGYTYGGSGSNFNVPDLRGRVPTGSDNMGTAAGAANRLPNSNRARGQNGGVERHTLVIAELPSHDHGGGNHSHGIGTRFVPGSTIGASAGGWLNVNQDSSGTAASGNIISAQGSGTAHNNMQPYVIANYIIKT